MSHPAGLGSGEPVPFHAVRIDSVRRLCRDAARIDRPFELERLVSAVLGRIWVRRAPLPDLPEDDLMFTVGKPLLDACVVIGGVKGKTVLAAISQIDRGELGVVAGALAGAVPKPRLPRWMPDVGRATITRAYSATAPEEEAVILRAERGRGDDHMIAAFLSDRLGGIAKQLGLLRPLDPLDPSIAAIGGRAESGLHFREVDPVLASGRVEAAIARTDEELAPPVGDDYWAHRALALARVSPTRSGVVTPYVPFRR